MPMLRARPLGFRGVDCSVLALNERRRRGDTMIRSICEGGVSVGRSPVARLASMDTADVGRR